ncbi:zinc finger HIT domain-containing protein 3 [Fopius arisanus]|uniref:Zinc finger HIT domain-containing protein 3 n=1 Tax=Fopius arisanus TaxID=64838 RepID=A0A9R1U9B3_9HYME|nr:PREDICTED: zinc finger HIT domain-containing protein 3 [Fopius arisanus]
MRNCCICSAESAAYKCPTCRQLYCSSACCRSHKSSPCSPPEAPEARGDDAKPPRGYDFPTEDTVPPQKLEQLRDNEDVKESLKNPHVRDIVRAILNDSDPTKAIALAMTEPIFVELADACLKVVEPQESPT